MTDPLDPQTQARPPRTLHERLAGRAAGIRGRVHGRVGDRPYRASLVVRRWSGGEPGRGRREEVSRLELRSGLDASGRPVPPKLVLSGQYSRMQHGLVDQGSAMLEELDPTYTEADLIPASRLEPGDEMFVDVEQDGRDGEAPARPARRFTLDGLPFRDPSRFQWGMRLRSQEPDASLGAAERGEGGGLP